MKKVMPYFKIDKLVESQDEAVRDVIAEVVKHIEVAILSGNKELIVDKMMIAHEELKKQFTIQKKQ